mmetsp:Transcript_32612/g.79690  ORF Transcript_32612/g.79690 Transcript_32612/m.79690 type:complete len:315 (-) Transcript_32612:704-1648(-)
MSLPKGTELTAQFSDGNWYKAEVVATRKGAKPIKVHFSGYSEADDSWCTLDQLRSKLLNKGTDKSGKDAKAAPKKAAAPKAAAGQLPPVGTELTAQFTDGEWYKAKVVAVSKSEKKAKKPVKVHFLGYDESEDTWVGIDGLRSKLLKKEDPAGKAKAKTKAQPKAKAGAAAPAGTVPVGTELTAQFTDGEWYKAQVTKVRKGPKPVRVHYLGYGDDEDQWVSLDQLRSKLLKGGAPAAAATAKGTATFSEGQKVKADYYGAYYDAVVLQVSTSPKRAKWPIQVEYTGYNEKAWLAADSIQSKSKPKSKAKAKKA